MLPINCCSLRTRTVVIANICILGSLFWIYHLNQSPHSGELIPDGTRSHLMDFIELITAVILIIFSTLLMIGVFNRHQILVRTWLCVVAFSIVTVCVILTIKLVPDLVISNKSKGIIYIVALFMVSYFWYVVLQFDQELAHQKRNEVAEYKLSSSVFTDLDKGSGKNALNEI